MLARKEQRKTATKVQITGESGRIPLRLSQRQTRTDQAVTNFGSGQVGLVRYGYGAAAKSLAYS